MLLIAIVRSATTKLKRVLLNASRRMQKRKEKKEEEHKDYSGCLDT